MPGQALGYVEKFAGSDADFGQPVDPAQALEEANVMTSEVAGTEGLLHKPVLDIDMPAKLIPSSTPGHFHLYIDHAMPWGRYAELLRALAAAGLIQEGFAESSIQRGYSVVRLPWIKKEQVLNPTP
jgi:hypothetical protein